MAVTLTQQVFHCPLYCAYVMGDSSNLAWDVIGRVIAASPVPVSGGHCPGFAVGVFVAQNSTSIITDIISSQHFEQLLVLVSLKKSSITSSLNYDVQNESTLHNPIKFHAVVIYTAIGP
jgi:hypothetical protein